MILRATKLNLNSLPKNIETIMISSLIKIKQMKTLILLLLLPISSLAETYDYKILRVIDGDTIVFEAPFLPKPLKPELSLRIYGVDTPEKRGNAQCEMEYSLAEEASEFTRSLVNKAKSRKVVIKQWDKYGGRVNGDLILDGKSLRTLLLNKGFAHLYYGDTKKPSWCEQ